ncbi:MAG: LysR family transcriptional regulator [Alkalinema sp. RU_4_3]|nr:LysR family transcriptional regulator [Alkalinema sp. RU_4_3]
MYLQLFVEVVKQRSFAAVARDRNVDPSSVSRAIAQMLKHLGQVVIGAAG